MSNKLTICLVTYNGEKYLKPCLKSVFKQSFKDWRLLIMDNGSKDDSAKTAREIIKDEPRAKMLPSRQSNLGFAGGYNVVMREAGGDYILLLNQDIILEPDYLEKIVKFMDNNESAAAVIGKIIKLTNGVKTSNIDTAGLRLFRSFRVADIGAGEKDGGQFNGTEEIFGVSGCLPLYRREALRQAEYFDNKFFSYKEDVDLAFRLRNLSPSGSNKLWKCYRAGAAAAYHERGLAGDEKAGDWEVLLNRRKKSGPERYLSYRNHIYVLIKNLSLSDGWRYGIYILWYELKKIIFIILFEPRTLYGWMDIIKRLPELLRQRKEVKPKSVKQWIR